MDELEISGKRYISSARAAKEHKYHADYIGQLVRGGKVVGQKVGRAWYVDAESLAEYLGKEVPARGPVAAKKEVNTDKNQVVEKGPEERPLTSVFGTATDLPSDPSQDQDLVEETEIKIESVSPKEEVEASEFFIPLRKRRQHVIEALDGGESKKKEEVSIKKIVEEKIEEVTDEPAPSTGFTEELLPEVDAFAEDAVERDTDERFIPVKISKPAPEPEDSFYKVSSKGLRYISGTKTAPTLTKKSAEITVSQPKEELAAVQTRRIKVQKNAAHFATAASMVLLAGIVSLGAGVLVSYYLHTVVTVEGSGQSSTVLQATN